MGELLSKCLRIILFNEVSIEEEEVTFGLLGFHHVLNGAQHESTLGLTLGERREGEDGAEVGLTLGFVLRWCGWHSKTVIHSWQLAIH